MAIFFNFSVTSSHLYPLQVVNCDSNSRLVVDKDDNDKFRRERVNDFRLDIFMLGHIRILCLKNMDDLSCCMLTSI